MISEKEIRKKWVQLQLSQRLKKFFGDHVLLSDNRIECIKNSRKSSVWKLEVSNQVYSNPIILKVIPSSQLIRNPVEIQMYGNAYHYLSYFMPKIYLLQSNVERNETWILMEHVQQIEGQCIITPQIFDKIIPTLANLHSHTYENNFCNHLNQFYPWLPLYNSKKRTKERTNFMNRTARYLESARKQPHLKEIIEAFYPKIQIILRKGPNFFSTLIDAGQSIIHGDLHMQNICCNNINGNKDWRIQFIDWEGAEFASTWFDMALLVEILIDYRIDWHKNADDIRRHCIDLYVREMKKHGITFKTDPLQLYKMAYLQRTLEKWLRSQLRYAISEAKKDSTRVFIQNVLEKITVWGKELELY
jgi:thiamine kinase-like enzyme